MKSFDDKMYHQIDFATSTSSFLAESDIFAIYLKLILTEKQSY